MKKLILIIAIFAASSMLIGCGAKSETKETKSPTVVSNTNVSTTNANTATVRGDGDADDLKSVPSNINKTGSKDRDDVRSGNNASKNANGTTKGRDSDDRGKKDSDSDDDDR